MQQTLAASTELDGHYAFLRATRFCDVSDPEIAYLAESLRNNSGDRETAVTVFGYVRDAIAYEVGNWQRTASQTLRRGRGTCTNSANLMVALLRSLGIPAGYGVMVVSGREYFGPAIPRRLTSRAGERSRHIYVCVRIDGRWVRCDPSDDAALSVASQHVNPQCTLIDWDGWSDALLRLDPTHIVEDRRPLPDIDALMARPMRKAMRFPVHIGNYFIGFLREHGESLADARDCHLRFEQWLARTHPACYLAYLTLPAQATRPSAAASAEVQFLGRNADQLTGPVVHR